MTSLAPGVASVQDPGGRDAVQLDGPGGRVLIALLGAQVLSWRSPHGEVLWCGSKAEYAPGKPVRGGIPLVFPWFGERADDPKLPAHGFVRNLPWRVVPAPPGPTVPGPTAGPPIAGPPIAGPTVELEVTDDAATRALWPHAFRLRFRVTLTEHVTFALTIENRGSAPFRCEEALHTYFAVGDVHTASVDGLQGVPCTETAAAPEGAWDTNAPLRFRAETDRVFQGVPDRVVLHTPALRRAVTLTTSNARSAIVWNPWPAKTARLSGLAPDDWTRFCCVESANVKSNAVTVGPRESHGFSLTLACRAT